jgi:hypothetical protein
MNKSDRRCSTRYALRIPIRFRESVAATEHEGYTGETTNISRNGLSFVTKVPLLLGSIVELALRVPRELSGSGKSEIQCFGQIVRMET